jgi:alpha,alpha-trehalase
MNRRYHLQHALVSNQHALALVGAQARVEFLCLPGFDGPSVFAALLDQDRGGVLDLVTNGPSESAYIEDTNALRTVFSTNGSITLSVTDFCPVGAPAFARWVQPSGCIQAQFTLDPRLDFGRSAARPERVSATVARIEDIWFTAPAEIIDVLMTSSPTSTSIKFERPFVLVISHGKPLELADPAAALQRAVDADRQAVATIPAPLRRCVLCIRGQTYAPTGAIIAAATTSVPEAIGEPRNWDYRYAWIRDGSFAAEALIRLGDTTTAHALLDFFQGAIGDNIPQPLYGIDGRKRLPEVTVPELSGFERTPPVRLGNAAATQTQHDTWGQLVWLAARLHENGVDQQHRYPWIASMVEGARQASSTTDAGIWEFRGRLAYFTFSQVWCWVALDRGASIAQALGHPRQATRWRTEAEQLSAAINAAADRVGFFAQTLNCDTVDASSLMLPSLGFVSATDPRFLETVSRCENQLREPGADDLLKRYVATDDFGDTTSSFSLCTLWWIEALAQSGQRQRAEALFEQFGHRANTHGLYSEDIDPSSRRMLGNFPQVYSHTGFINAWLAITS